MKRRVLVALVVLAFVAGAARARAGIVVLRNGNVLVGLIEPEDVTADAITVRNVGVAGGQLRGKTVIARADVRWFDAAANGLTREYAREFRGAPIEVARQAELARLIAELDEPPPPPIVVKRSGIELAAVLHPLERGKLRKPAAWTPSRVGEIDVFLAPRPGANGFVPRLHVFSVEAPRVEPSRQAEWVREEAGKLSDGGLEVLASGALRVVRGGFTCEWVTATRRDGRTVKALRHVLCREDRTWVVTGYADEADFDGLVEGFRRVATSLEP